MKCFVKNCASSQHFDWNLSFHRFPKEESRIKLWVQACRLEDVINTEGFECLRTRRICSLHFLPTMYNQKGKLINSAVPSIFGAKNNFENDRNCEEKQQSNSGEDLRTRKNACLAERLHKKTKELKKSNCVEATENHFQTIDNMPASSEITVESSINKSTPAETKHWILILKPNRLRNQQAETQNSMAPSTSGCGYDVGSIIGAIEESNANNTISNVKEEVVVKTEFACTDDSNIWLGDEENEAVPVEREENSIHDMCVLCAKDISELPGVVSVAGDSDLILAVTGVNILQYRAMQMRSCSSCYKSLLAIKAFRVQVCTASDFLIRKLRDAGDLSIDATNVNNTGVETARMQKTHSTEDDDVLSNDPNVLNVVDPFFKCGACGSFCKDVANHSCYNVTNNKLSAIRTIYQTSHCETVLKSPKREKRQLGPKKVCGLCGKTYIGGSYQEHAKTHAVKCKFCRKMYTQVAHYRDHMETHFKTCSVCGDQYLKVDYVKHMETHPGTTVECHVCQGEIKTDLLKQHMQEHDTKKKHVPHGAKKHQCHVCGLSFLYVKYFERHLRSHSVEKPFACLYCNRRFTKWGKKEQHERLHTNAKFRHNVLKTRLSRKHSASEIPDSIKEPLLESDLEKQSNVVSNQSLGNGGKEGDTKKQLSKDDVEKQMNVEAFANSNL